MTDYELLKSLREDYYEVYIYKCGEEDHIECFMVYDTPENIVFTMDATLESLGYGDCDWSEMSAAVGYGDTTVAYMGSLDNPEFEIVSDIDKVMELVA